MSQALLSTAEDCFNDFSSGGSSVHAGRGDSDWKMRENQENERNFEGGRGRGGRGLGPRSRGGGHVGLAPRQRGRGGPRGAGGPRADFAERGGGPAEGLGQIDTWNPIGSEKQEKQDQRLRHNKDAFENAGNWGDDFPGKNSQSYWQVSGQSPTVCSVTGPCHSSLESCQYTYGRSVVEFSAAEDWDNDEYTGSLSDTKVFTPSGSSAKAVGEPVNGSVGHGAAPGGNYHHQSLQSELLAKYWVEFC